MAKPIFDFPLLESTEIHGLVTVGHGRKLRVELAGIVLIRIQHVLRDASNELFQEVGRVLHPSLCSRSGQKDDALGDAALIVRRTVKGSLHEPSHQIAALLVTNGADARQLMKLDDAFGRTVQKANQPGRNTTGRRCHDGRLVTNTLF